jgi:hypothetical protein
MHSNCGICNSQGTAVIFNAVSALPANIKSRVVGAVLYGYTKNAQNRGVIPNYPADRVKTFCPKSDGVCNGGLNVNGGHFSYLSNGDIKLGTQFLVQRIRSGGGGGGGGEGGGGGGSESPAGFPKGGRGKGGAKGKGGFS